MKHYSCLLGLVSFSATVIAGGRWTQCGGSLWKGDTTCSTPGWSCQIQNSYYSQCLPLPGVPDAPGNDDESNGSDESDCDEGDDTQSPTQPHSGSGASSSNTTPAQSASTLPASSSGSTGSQSNPKPNTSGSCNAFSGSKTGYATTTHYFDKQKGACGCGTGNSMSSWQDNPSTKVYTAAGSQNLFGGSGSWCGPGCGTCYELTNMGAIAGPGEGDCTGAGETITVMISNLCPAVGNEQWCSVPNQFSFPAHFDIMSKQGPEGWNNPVVSYKQVACPASMTSDWKTCECATGAHSRARRGLMGDTF